MAMTPLPLISLFSYHGSFESVVVNWSENSYKEAGLALLHNDAQDADACPLAQLGILSSSSTPGPGSSRFLLVELRL